MSKTLFSPYRKRTQSVFLALLVFTSFEINAQTKRFVTPGASGTGNSWADPGELQATIDAAGAGDSVFVAQGSYQRAAAQFYSMKEGVKIYGGFEGTEATLGERDLAANHVSTLRGNGASVVRNNNNGLTAAAVLDGFTLTNGNAQSGGGVYNFRASPTISHCIFTTNSGGGIYNQYATTTIIKCVFAGNTSTTFYQRAGGVSNFNADGVNIINCLFVGNSGYSVGGVWAQDVDYRDMVTNIINCTFYGNTAIAQPNSTISGAIYFDGSRTSLIKNCIAWGNSSGIKVTDEHNIGQISNNIIQGGYLLNWEINPLFVNSANPIGPDNIWGTADDGLRLQTGSQAFDNGTPDITGLPLPGTDMLGMARVQGGRIDLGVYEGAEACNPFTTLHVDSSVTASGDGGTWATAFKTLNEALIAANRCTNVENIYVAKGTYQPSAGNSFSMVQHVKMYGGFPGGGSIFSQRNPASYATILKGNNNSVLYNWGLDATALLDGFTITGGRAIWGGGFFNQAAPITINNCIIADNESYLRYAYQGGGSGGGMYNTQGSDCVITNCQFTGNEALNTSNGGGGAICNSGSSPFISHCVFTNNTGGYGGAIYNASGTRVAIINNTIFAGNSASGDGGAIENTNVTNQLTNVTFVNNTAGATTGGGGAIDNWQSTLIPTNCIFWGNTASKFNDIWQESGSLNITYSLTQVSLAGTGNILGSASPFVDIANPAGADGIWNTADDGLILPAGSPCVNAGTPDTTGLGLGDTDIAGNLRIAGAAIDLGAYEYSSATLPISLIGFSGNLQQGITSLQWHSGEELNFHHFEVEKSTNGALFLLQGKVPAKGSNSAYTFTTTQQEPVAYYRLKMVDLDGRAVNSRIIRLSQKAGNDMLVYPNPATNYINIQSPGAGSLSIYAADGKLLRIQTMQAGVNSVDITGLGAGVYYAVMNGTQVKFIKK